MSYYRGTVEYKLATMAPYNKLSELIESQEYAKICAFIIKDDIDNLKANVKKILDKFHSRERITKLIATLINVLNADICLWDYDKTIKELFNEIERQAICLLPFEGENSSAHKIYNNIVELQVERMFKCIREYLEKIFDAPDLDPSFFHMAKVTIHFTKLLDINGYDPVLFPMTKFADFLTKFIQFERIHPFLITFVSHINHRLISYLAVTVGELNTRGLNEAVNIYNMVRQGVVQMIFLHPEVISSAINILEYRSRFFGLYADAIPENKNHGDYIVLDPLNVPFEDDEVYDDYEAFLDSLLD